MRTGGKSRGTKDTDPRVIRARRIVGLEFRDNWNRDDNAKNPYGRARHGRGNRKHRLLLLLYHPSVQKKITIFPLAAFFQSSLPYSTSNRIRSKSSSNRSETVRVEEARWFRGGRLDSSAAGISKTERERGRGGSIDQLGCGTKRYCILDLIESGNLFVHRDFLRLV